jgi:hypothetical protein
MADSRVTLRCGCKDAVRLDVFAVLKSGRVERGLTSGTMRRLRSAEKPGYPYLDKLHKARAGSGQLWPHVGTSGRYEYDCGKCGQHHEWRDDTLRPAVVRAREAGRREIVAGQDL